MKLLHSLLPSIALADFTQMSTDFSDAVSAFSQANGDRTITQSDMALINEYGCWCYFQNDHHKGKGQPTDGIDSLCKRLHDGYTCAMIDAQAMGDTCVPWEVTYQSATGAGLAISMDLNTIRTECDNQNPNTNDCVNWACKIEGYFVQQLLFFFVQGGQIDQNSMHSNNFDPNVRCPVSQGTKSERECCDQQPLRFPFKTYGDRQCCVNRTYDVNIFQCCADGSLAIGACP